MTERPLCAVVLAAGAGIRMRSTRPKPIHLLCGRPMVAHVLDSLVGNEMNWVVLVIGHEADRVVKELNSSGAAKQFPIHYVEQSVQKGTGDAVSIALSSLPEDISDEAEDADMLILPGDVPLLDSETIAKLVQHHREHGSAATVLTVELDDPVGYGRIVRDKHGRMRSIVEHADATPEQLEIHEVNSSVYCFRTSLLGPALRRIHPSNAQGEYYLTDVIEVLAEAGHSIETVAAENQALASGVNDRVQLAAAEVKLRKRINDKWMRFGVTMVDPSATYIDSGVEIGEDTCLHPGVRLQGKTVIGVGCEVGPYVQLMDCVIGDGVTVRQTYAQGAIVGARAQIGPFAVLQPGSEIPEGAVIGPFFTATNNTSDEG